MPESALELFRDACGLRAPLALECQDASRTHVGAVTYQLECPFAVIGRDSQSDLVLNGPAVSRRHAFVQVIDGRAFCIDLDSRTQLCWDGQAENQTRGWLDAQRTCRIGPFAIRRVGVDFAECTENACADPLTGCDSGQTDADSTPRAGLDLPIRIGEGDHVWRMAGRLALIGRSESCQVMLRDPSVSRFHAVLLRTSKGVWIVDLQARQGLLINGVRVRWAWLEDGDTVAIGQFTSILRYESIPREISRREVPIEAGAVAPSSRVAGRSGSGGTSLAVRPNSLPAAPSRAAKRLPAVQADVLVPERVAEWEQGGLPASQQVAMWQQQMQMMESFHRDMILMVQMFVAMHREHRGAIRGELDRVEKLTRKLSVLQKQLTENESQQGHAAGLESGSRKDGKAHHADRNGASRVKSQEGPRAEPDAKRSRGASPQPAGQPAAGAPSAAGDNSPGDHVKSRSPAFNPAEFHSQLTQRITELQRKRQNYWQRILSAINK